MSSSGWNCFLFLAFACGMAAGAAKVAAVGTAVPPGAWGGEHIHVTVSEEGADVEFDCAAGRLDEPLMTDRDGRFEAHGVYLFEPGGPQRMGDPPPAPHAALYRGWTNGTDMRLEVILLETARSIGPFSLGLGRPSRLEKCL